MAYVVTNHLKYEHFDDLDTAINFLKTHDDSYKILKQDAFGNLMPVSQSELIRSGNSSQNPPATVPWPKNVYSGQTQQPQNQISQNQMISNTQNTQQPPQMQQQFQQPQVQQNGMAPQVMPYMPYPVMPNQSRSGNGAFVKFMITIILVIIILLAFGFGFSYVMNLIVNFFKPT